jgi:hypothetical protein
MSWDAEGSVLSSRSRATHFASASQQFFTID